MTKIDDIICDKEGQPIYCPCCSEYYSYEHPDLIEAYEMIQQGHCPACFSECIANGNINL